MLIPVHVTVVLGIFQVKTDDSGNTILPPFQKASAGGGSGAAETEERGTTRNCTCTSPPNLLSFAVVDNPTSHADRSYRLSLLYCHWSGPNNRFTTCSPGHSYGGNANFQLLYQAAL